MAFDPSILSSSNENSSNTNAFRTIPSGSKTGYYSWSHDDVYKLLTWVSENMPESFKHLNKANVNAITKGAFPHHTRIKCSNVKNKLSNLKRRYLVLKQKLEKVSRIENSTEIEKVQSMYPST